MSEWIIGPAEAPIERPLPPLDECKAYWRARFSEWAGEVQAAANLWGAAYR